jgi:hypothetical protein
MHSHPFAPYSWHISQEQAASIPTGDLKGHRYFYVGLVNSITHPFLSFHLPFFSSNIGYYPIISDVEIYVLLFKPNIGKNQQLSDKRREH